MHMSMEGEIHLRGDPLGAGLVAPATACMPCGWDHQTCKSTNVRSQSSSSLQLYSLAHILDLSVPDMGS